MQLILRKFPLWVWKNLISLIALGFAIFSTWKSTSVQHSTHFADYNKQAWEDYNFFRGQCEKLPTEVPLEVIDLIGSLSDTISFVYSIELLNMEWETSVVRLISETASKIHAYQLVVGQKEQLDAIKPFDEEIRSLRPPSAVAKELVLLGKRGTITKVHILRLPEPPVPIGPSSGSDVVVVSPPTDECWQFYNPIMAFPRAVWRPDQPPPLVNTLDSLTTESMAKVLKAWYSSMQK